MVQGKSKNVYGAHRALCLELLCSFLQQKSSAAASLVVKVMLLYLCKKGKDRMAAEVSVDVVVALL